NDNPEDHSTEDGITTWLQEVLADEAQQAAPSLSRPGGLQALVTALRSPVEDTISCATCQAMLPDFIQAHHSGELVHTAGPRFVELRNHLALCPHCTAAYEQVMVALQESERDVIPPAEAYPTFDLAFLADAPVAATPSLGTLGPLALIDKAIEQ